MIKGIQPPNIATTEKIAAITRIIRNGPKARAGFINRRAASAAAGTEKIMIGIHAMVVFGTNNRVEAIKLAVRSRTPKEE
jgi:hypothetical protein